MSAYTLPLESSRVGSAHQSSDSKKTPWTPTDRDRLIFQWVKFDGHKQSWVAEQLDINQSTVSRIVERYERWIARGGLTHPERVRYQRWLTYERNERILASALRIAEDMEGQIDVSRTTITRSNLSPSQENEVKTQHGTIDRTSAASRFLRLAHRINMDQLKLMERAPLPDLEPLTIEEAEELLEASPPQSRDQWSQSPASGRREPPGNVASETSVNPAETHETAAGAGSPDPAAVVAGSPDAPVVTAVVAGSPDAPLVTGSPDPVTSTDRQVSTDMHSLHTPQPADPNLTSTQQTTSPQKSTTKKVSPPAYPEWLTPPEISAAIEAPTETPAALATT